MLYLDDDAFNNNNNNNDKYISVGIFLQAFPEQTVALYDTCGFPSLSSLVFFHSTLRLPLYHCYLALGSICSVQLQGNTCFFLLCIDQQVEL